MSAACHAPTPTVGEELPPEPGCRPGLERPDVTVATGVAAILAEPSRAGILALLGAGPYCVCEFAEALGERPNNVSNHLARLRAAGLVRAVHHQADARWVYYERDETACAAALAPIRDLLDPHHHA